MNVGVGYLRPVDNRYLVVGEKANLRAVGINMPPYDLVMT